MVLLATVAACGDAVPIAATDLALRLSGPESEVDLGVGFGVSVVRIWSKEFEPDPWSASALAPLSARLVESTRRQDGRRVEETLRYRCHAFEPGEARVEPVAFDATDASGASRSVTGNPLVIRVRPLLDPAAPGDLEYPEPMPLRQRRWGWAIACVVLIGALLLLARRGLRRAAGVQEAVDLPPDPLQPVRVRLRALRRGVAADEAFHADAAAIARLAVAARGGPEHPSRTSEEVLAGSWEGRDELLDDATRVLTACDAVKFGGLRSDEARRAQVLADLARLAAGDGE